MTYVDGFVLAVPTANKAAYLKHAQDCVPIFKKYGALRVVECWGADVPDGEETSFPMAVKLKPDETAVFSWIEWPDRATRDKGMEEMVNDPFFADESQEMPFDGKRMILGSFDMILDD